MDYEGSTDQRVARDGTAFFAGSGGIWKLRPDAQITIP
jgi:hypothetical protein